MKEFKPFEPPKGDWTEADVKTMTKRVKWRLNTTLSRHGHIYFEQWFNSLTKEELAIFEEATQYLVGLYLKRCCSTTFGGSVNDLPVSTTYMLERLEWDVMKFLRIGKNEFEGVSAIEWGLRYRLINMYARKLLARVYRSKPKAEWLRGASIEI